MTLASSVLVSGHYKVSEAFYSQLGAFVSLMCSVFPCALRFWVEIFEAKGNVFVLAWTHYLAAIKATR